MSDDYMFVVYATRKCKFTSHVEYWAKLDAPTSSHGYYAVLELNQAEVYRWKLNKLDEMLIFNENLALRQRLSEDELRTIRQVHKDALDEFIANKISDVIGQVIAFQTQGVIQ